MVKCGFMIYEEFNNPYRCQYRCKYFNTLANTEKCLCSGCHFDKVGTPHMEGFEFMDCTEEYEKCYWYKDKKCECKYQTEEK